ARVAARGVDRVGDLVRDEADRAVAVADGRHFTRAPRTTARGDDDLLRAGVVRAGHVVPRATRRPPARLHVSQAGHGVGDVVAAGDHVDARALQVSQLVERQLRDLRAHGGDVGFVGVRAATDGDAGGDGFTLAHVAERSVAGDGGRARRRVGARRV